MIVDNNEKELKGNKTKRKRNEKKTKTKRKRNEKKSDQYGWTTLQSPSTKKKKKK